MASTTTNSPRVKRRKTINSASPRLGTASLDVVEDVLSQRCQADNETKRLDKQIRKGKDFIRLVLPDIPRHASSEALRRDLKNMLSRPTSARCKLAVFGASGAGKSTLLNALLEEYGVLPSGSMGEACTPVPIEILWNNDDKATYKAEFEYITEADWRHDIETARSAAEVGGRPAGDASNPIDKIMAAYPQLTEDKLIDMTANDILASNNVRDLLGRRDMINHTDRKAFEKQLRSRLVARASNTASKQQQPVSWPLISVVRLYVASEVLRGGLVLVDVPGILDSNTARATRAKQYIQECSAICIVAPAIRAGSDSTFHGLVEDALRQVQYSNRLDRVVLICTKADDFDADEVRADLQDPAIDALSEKKCQAQEQYEHAKEQVEIHEHALQQDLVTQTTAANDIIRWNKKAKDIRDGKIAYPPPARINGKAGKPDPDANPIDQTDIDREVVRLKTQKKSATSRRKAAQTKIESEQVEADTKYTELMKATTELNKLLLRARNDFLKQKLSTICAKKVTDHLESIRQAGQEVTTQSPIDTTENVGSSGSQQTLPVFCVSAVKHLQLCGLKHHDSTSPSTSLFANKHDTGIPSLLLHLSSIATAAQQDMLSSAHTRLLTALNDLDVFLLQDVEMTSIDPILAATAIEEANSILKNVNPKFETYSKQTSDVIDQTYRLGFVSKLDEAKKFSTSRVLRAMPTWMRKRGNDGLFYTEYKAAVSRNGVWSGTRRSINFNDDVADKVQAVIHRRMEQLFTSDASTTRRAIDTCLANMTDFCEELHGNVRNRAVTAGVSAYALRKIDEQLGNRKTILKDIHEAAKRDIGDVSGLAAVGLSTDIQVAWRGGYQAAKKVSTGTGALQAMHDTLSSSLVEDGVLSGPVEKLEERLNENVARVLQGLAEQVWEMVSAMVQNYHHALEKREEKAVAVKDPMLNKVRNEMVARGYAKISAEIKEEDSGDGMGK